MLENISLSFQGIWGHKMRSFLTMLGIIIGIASIITIVSTIKGTNEQIKENLIGAGNNVVRVFITENGYSADFNYQPIPETVLPISEETRQKLEKLEGVDAVTLYRMRQYPENVYIGDASFGGTLYAIDQNYLSVYGYQITQGRGFSERDYTELRKNILIDNKTAGSLFEGMDPIGKTIEIKGEPFTVIGIAAMNGTNAPTIHNVNEYYMYMDQSAGNIFIPDTTWPIIYKYDEPQNVAAKAKTTDDMTLAGKNIATALQASQILDPNGVFGYKADDLLEQASSIQALSETTNTQLIWIAGISLLVGGIGVMNIMLVSVTERTREIGLKKALGARRSRILFQFLTEAAVLTSLGGILGVICGIGLAQLMSSIMGTPVAISLPAGVIALVFSMVIGIVFGLIPAVKASRLNPIEALRYQ